MRKKGVNGKGKRCFNFFSLTSNGNSEELRGRQVSHRKMPFASLAGKKRPFPPARIHVRKPSPVVLL